MHVYGGAAVAVWVACTVVGLPNACDGRGYLWWCSLLPNFFGHEVLFGNESCEAPGEVHLAPRRLGKISVVMHKNCPFVRTSGFFLPHYLGVSLCQGLHSLLCSRLELSTVRSPSFISNCGCICQTLRLTCFLARFSASEDYLFCGI